jgi:kinesin family protein 1
MAGGNIKVVVRVRPFNGRELDRHAKCVVQMKDAQTILIPPPDAEDRLRSTKGGKVGDAQKVFAFDKSYWSFNRQDPHFAGQDHLFQDLGAPLLDNAFKGYNNCIFAYGQTGSGKSYSMMGYGEEAGVIPRICEDMFRRITETQKDKNLTYTVEVSYLEIYNERVRDLLNPATKGNLKVREHPSTGPYVEDLAKLVVRSFQEIQHLMDEGNKARTVAATSMNETSSRSHAVFTLTVTQKRHDVETQLDTEKVAKISLVDLAGSERATSTGATGARLKEGAEINRSLSTLGRVIAALADLSTGKKKNMSMVPYRDSVLTWLLKDSLGGNSMTAMIAAISPADINFEETLSTLRYADSAKRIKNHAVVNEDPNARMIRELKEELAQLRSKLNSGVTHGGLARGEYAPGTPLDQQVVSITQADGTIKTVSKAEIAEQLSQSEKIYEDLNQTWEEKLQKTEQIHKEREAALEELGISIEKGFVGLSTPKKMPHLVNLSDDPLLAECLVYNIKPGKTGVGNVEDPSTTSEIRLNGTKILRDHCTFENADRQVTIIPRDGAAVMVNGVRIEAPTRLRSGNRIILGDFHIFRFNHPMEARAERKEQSLLRHTVTTIQLGSPGPRAGHSRTLSRADSDVDGDISRPESPMPVRNGRDSDWSYARREAAGAILGVDQKISNMTEDELDSLFDDVQRERAVRKYRPESRSFGQDDEDVESLVSCPTREKYMSNGTFENLSSDTAITIPSTPSQASQQGEIEALDEEGALQAMQADMQSQLESQKDEFDQQLQVAESISSNNVEELKAENERMEIALLAANQELQIQLTKQKEAFARELQQVSKALAPRVDKDGVVDLSEEEKRMAKKFAKQWRRVNFVRLAEIVLQNAATLKEAQVRIQALDRHIVFQFTIVGQGHDMCSSYDLVLSGISGDEDPALDDIPKPCIAVRVIDYEHNVIHLWSIEKLELRVQAMRQMDQYLGRPEYMQHFRPENPFIEPCLPRFSLVGEADVPLATVFEARVHDYSLDVISVYTYETMGIVRLSLEPSSARAPPSMLKFNVVMHDMVGLAEREGTEVHAQMFIPGVSEEGGVTTTQIIAGFDEEPIRFESVHSMTLPVESPRNTTLRVAIYAKVHEMHLDKLLSWDDLRESALGRSRQRKRPRISETQYRLQEQHDVFAKLMIAELAESGEYLPVEVQQNSNSDPGTYQLHQGLQRRIIFNLTYSSNESMKWEEVKSFRVGNLRLINLDAPISPLSHESREVPLKLVQDPSFVESTEGTMEVKAVGQWDSSLHASLLLDRATAEKYAVGMSVSIEIGSAGIDTSMTFSVDQQLQIRPRSWLRPQSLFKQLWKTTRITHSTSSIFSVLLKPAPAKRAADIWRMNSQNGYIKGEESLSNWRPRGVGLIQEFARSQQRRRRTSEVEATRVFLRCHKIPSLFKPPDSDHLTDHQLALIRKCLDLWTTSPQASIPHNRPSTPSSLPSTPSHPSPSRLHPTVIPVPKNQTVVKSSYILSPSLTSLRWQRHFAELRPPYLHIYAVPSGDETAILNLRNARIDPDPPVQQLLQSERVAKNVFAIYAPTRSWLFAARNEMQKGEWILAIDEGFAGDGG